VPCSKSDSVISYVMVAFCYNLSEVATNRIQCGEAALDCSLSSYSPSTYNTTDVQLLTYNVSIVVSVLYSV